MRGRAFKNALIIRDEARNTFPSQAKVFVTRIGENSRMFLDGDPARSDLRDSNDPAVLTGMAQET